MFAHVKTCEHASRKLDWHRFRRRFQPQHPMCLLQSSANSDHVVRLSAFSHRLLWICQFEVVEHPDIRVQEAMQRQFPVYIHGIEPLQGCVIVGNCIESFFLRGDQARPQSCGGRICDLGQKTSADADPDLSARAGCDIEMLRTGAGAREESAEIGLDRLPAQTDQPRFLCEYRSSRV